MKLSALEIKQQEFEKNFRGYDPNEVKAFLSVVASEWENMVSKNKQLEQDVVHLKDKLSHFEKIQEGMHETLQIAKQSADKEVSAASAEARSRIHKAELEAEQIINRARAERQEVRQSIIRMLERREDIVNNIKNYLDLANESLNKFSKDSRSYAEMKELKQPMDQDPPASSKPTNNKMLNNSFSSTMKGMTDDQDVDRIIDEID